MDLSILDNEEKSWSINAICVCGSNHCIFLAYLDTIKMLDAKRWKPKMLLNINHIQKQYIFISIFKTNMVSEELNSYRTK